MTEKLMDAIGQLPEELLAPAARVRRTGTGLRRWLPLAAAAVCALALLALPVTGLMAANNKGDFAQAENAQAPMEAPEAVMDKSDYFSDHSYAGADQARERFLARVLAVQPEAILVEPLEDEWEHNVAAEVLVRLPEAAPRDLAPGELVSVVYNGMIAETFPPQASNVLRVDRLG